MPLDIEIIKKILKSLDDSPSGFLNHEDFTNEGFKIYEPDFIKHFLIIRDEALIVNESGEKNCGLHFDNNSKVTWWIRPVRLTSKGHDFLKSLENEQITKKIQSRISSIGIGVLTKTLSNLAVNYFSSQ